MPDFLLYAIIAGSCVALLAGPIGCLVVWQRMAYYGDTLAHAALLGAALALWLQINLLLGVAIMSIVLALLLGQLQQGVKLSTDSLLGILAHSSLAIGLVCLSLIDNARIDLNSYLFGDLLAIQQRELVLIILGSIAVAIILQRLWSSLLAVTLAADLAAVDGIAVARSRLWFLLLVASLVVLAIKTVGALLMTALLIIPAAAARPLARSPEMMALFASLAGLMAVAIGLCMSWYLDTPAGPSIIVGACLLFCCSLGFSALRRRRH